ncbi:MAG TPA: hypothetical protein VME66_09200, partial [Candidatus Acidoferrales bacterium]|nr:hypothetical protein [Candidatus Acidoferrales bacterium]
MPLSVPSLDTRTFDDLVAEAKQRIPRYLPEWTDFNESDPGIVLVELFAWMTEAVLYELNQAPTVLQLKLLQLLGFETQPAQAATTELQFSLNLGVPTAIVPAQTRVVVSGATYSDGSPVIFETDRAVVAIGATLGGVVAINATSATVYFSDPTATPPATFQPFPTSPTSGLTCAMYLCFTYNATTFPGPLVDLAIFLGDAPGDNLPPYPAPSYTCTFGEPPPVPTARWIWEYLDGSGSWQSVNLLSDATAALYRSGHVQFQFPTPPVQATPNAPPSTSSPNPLEQLMSAVGSSAAQTAQLQALQGMSGFWIRARLTSATYEQPPTIVAMTTNTAPATAAQTVTNEVVGASTGLAAQQFTLANSPVLPATLVLTVDEGISDGTNTWTQVADFYGSSATAMV